ncbi:MAG: DUF4954 family protein [Bacteroidales bacterium]|nr:DUF4954 family protein [Bacteroidales bacterium]
MTKMRHLTPEEITVLEQRGCTAQDWDRIQVADPFRPANYRFVRFSGDIALGTTDGTFTLEGGITLQSGIFDATLHNVTVGNDVFIRSIANYIANYDIADGAFIENVNRMVTRPGATFGVGVEVSVLNETGGREVPIYPRLSAQTAYLMAMYRHNPALTHALNELAAKEVDKARSNRGYVGEHALILNSGSLTDVNVGAHAHIEGASQLTNGTIAGSKDDPVYVGANVMADDFIMASGAKVEDGVVLLHVFVGQGSHLTHLFSAHDSLFFANCSCENGEACAIFAGPYTVTMHKSSLLIAGMFSFLNAGSGSNQSNHMYKLGPIHQGIVERGSKTTSDSYILWPAKIGAFSLVMGRHVSHPDTSRLPFSYLIENKGRSYLVPGVNLKSVGSIRDAQKWPKRDRRRDPDRLDLINFNLLSPYTISKMMDARQLLDEIEAVAGVTADRYAYQAVTIEARALKKGRNYYSMAIDKFMGNSIVKRLEGLEIACDDDIRLRLAPTHAAGQGEWLDIGGMIAPKSEISALCRDIIEGAVTSLEEVEQRFRQLHADYYDMEWTWVVEHFQGWWGKPIEEVTAADIKAIAERWRDSVVGLDRLLYDDARKEFSLCSKVGFGVDGGCSRQESDFEQVRGAFDSDPFVRMVLDHIDAKSSLATELISRLP